MENNSKMWSGFFIGLGIVILGILLLAGINNFKNADRRVAVRGLSEREVQADMVLWPVVYTQTGNDLQTIYNELEIKNKAVVNFLTTAGIDRNEVMVNSASVADLDADRYTNNQRGYRYIATQVITVNSSSVAKVVELQRRQNELFKHNIALQTDMYQYPTQFIFTKLNDIKPEMIEEATKAARESAEKFASDSQSEVGAILNASQGQFSIEDRDQYTPQIKKVRVVTTIEYSLN